MLTRKVAVATITKLQAQLSAITEPSVGRKKMRVELGAKRKQVVELETMIAALEAKIKRSEELVEKQRKIIAALSLLAKELMTEDAQVEFEVKSEGIFNG